MRCRPLSLQILLHSLTSKSSLQVTDVNLYDTFNWRIGQGATIASSSMQPPLDAFDVHVDSPTKLTLHGIGLSQGVAVGSDYLLRNTCVRY
jgi:hypothetical protein